MICLGWQYFPWKSTRPLHELISWNCWLQTQKNGPFGLTIKRIVDLDCPENVWFGKTYGKWIRPLHESFSWPSISGELLLNKDLWGWALFGSPPVHWSFECPCRCLRLFFIMNNLYSKSWCENVTIPMPLFKKNVPANKPRVQGVHVACRIGTYTVQ